MSSFDVVKHTFMQGMMIVRDGIALAFNPPPISGMSNTGGFEGYIQNRMGGSMNELSDITQGFIASASKRPELTGLQSTFSANVPQININLDREKTKSLNVPIAAVYDTLQATFGSTYVNDFNKFGRTFRVQLQAEADFRSKIDDLKYLYVRSQQGNMIPISSLVTVQQTIGPESLDRFNVFPSAKIVGNAAPGFSSGEALQAMEQVASEVLPESYSLAWGGSAFQERSTSGSSSMVFGFGLIMVFLILAALYERWHLPIAILMAVPFAVFGALLANILRGLSNDIYFQVALVTLIGLAAKNAILIVEFAMIHMNEGMDRFEAALYAAKQRFRPIIMTSLAFILGCVPLAISSGAGSASRHSIGTGVIGGMLAATFIATFFIPLFFTLIVRTKSSKKNSLPEGNSI
jgi:HAE1 family hydrophobic/amphiphilic exporter-1/multidrug efflux pump